MTASEIEASNPKTVLENLETKPENQLAGEPSAAITDPEGDAMLNDPQAKARLAAMQSTVANVAAKRGVVIPMPAPPAEPAAHTPAEAYRNASQGE